MKGHHTLVLIGIFNYCKGRYDKAIEVFSLCQEKCPEYKNTVDSYLADAIRKRSAEPIK